MGYSGGSQFKRVGSSNGSKAMHRSTDGTQNPPVGIYFGAATLNNYSYTACGFESLT